MFRNRYLPGAARSLLAIVLVLMAAQVADARHRRHVTDAEPGDFSYYVLSLSWSPAFCLTEPQSGECRGSRRYGFIVHGLWPQNESGWPQDCASDVQVGPEIVEEMTDIMPSATLVRHEWQAHGSCSGLPPAPYFDLVRRAYRSVAIPDAFSQAAAQVDQAPAEVSNAFLQANPKLTPQSISLTCSGQGAPRLREVHICLSRGLSPRACSDDERRRACRATLLVIPPIR